MFIIFFYFNLSILKKNKFLIGLGTFKSLLPYLFDNLFSLLKLKTIAEKIFFYIKYFID
jgi:hypothetical protein